MAVKRAVIAAVVGQFGHPRGTAGRVAGWVMAHRPSNRRRNRWVVSLLEVQPTDRVLEIGVGPGLAIAELSRRVGDQGRVYGIDHSEVMLRQATRHNASAIAAGRVSLSRASVDQLPPSHPNPAAQGPRRAPPATPPARSKPCSRTPATPGPGQGPWTLPWSASSPPTPTPLATTARRRQTPGPEAGVAEGLDAGP
jgi:hypothetical protein